MRDDYRTTMYLQALALLCLEVAAEPRLLLPFLAVLRLVPSTLRALEHEARRRIAV